MSHVATLSHSHWTSWRRAQRFSLPLLLLRKVQRHEVTPSLLFSTLDKPKVLSLSLEDIPCSSLPNLVFLLWKHSRTLACSCSCGAQQNAQQRLHLCWTQQDNPLSWLAGHVSFDVLQDVAYPLGCLGTQLPPLEPVANQHSQVPSCRAALQTLLSQLRPVPGITASQHLDWLNFMPLMTAQCFNLSRSPCKHSCLSSESKTSPNVSLSTSLLRGYSTPTSR